jgi:hypothetical protein
MTKRIVLAILAVFVATQVLDFVLHEVLLASTYQATASLGTAPAQIASLAYDAVSLVALLSQGPAYHRFTAAALADPNGFAGVNGIFRFNNDGTSERGLAVLEMTPSGPVVVSPAPTTFQGKNS